jgi:hypothetical protein
MPEPAVDLDVGDVVVPPPIEAEVRVVDALGPVSGAVVRWASPGDEVYARTDRDGLCRLTICDPADPVVEATHPERGTGRLRPGCDDRPERVTVALRPAGAERRAASR